jgi:peptidoglycan/LPS O-acetylase OafA/YrhL
MPESAAAAAAAGIYSLPGKLREGLQMRQLPALDAIRAVAAFLVVFYHFSADVIPGGLGVLAFFVLSGFLITWLLLIEAEKFSGISLRLFYLRRSLRIFPAFYCYWVLVIGLLLLLDKRIIWPQVWSSFFYVNNYYQALNGDPSTLLSHTWSLGVEEQFYLLWPAAFALLWRNPRRMISTLVIVIAGVWVHRELLYFVWKVPGGYIYEAFDTRADHLAIGCLLAVVLRTGACAGFWRGLCATPVFSILTFAALVGSVLMANSGIQGYRDSVGFIVDPVLVALLIPQLIAFRETALWRWVNWGWVQYLGRISYSIYLYQQIVPDIVRNVAPAADGPVRLGIQLGVLLVMASGSYWVIEKPFLALKDRYGTRRKERHIQSVGTEQPAL